MRLDDGRLVIPSPRSISSNVMLISDRGYDEGMRATEVALQPWVNGIVWGEAVQQSLMELRVSRH